jgi:transposase-like protein
MAAGPSIDVTGWLQEQFAQASPDLLRSMVQTFAEALMGAEADAVCGAVYGERSDERTNIRNGSLNGYLSRLLLDGHAVQCRGHHGTSPARPQGLA